jgi:phosphoribosylformylglycinamidine synthase PurS subunit
MASYIVEVVIENKPAARDPEGETIGRDLINKGGYKMIAGVRTGKYLRMKVKAKSEKDAKNIVFKMCNELRIYNPVVHTVTIHVKDVEK